MILVVVLVDYINSDHMSLSYARLTLQGELIVQPAVTHFHTQALGWVTAGWTR